MVMMEVMILLFAMLSISLSHILDYVGARGKYYHKGCGLKSDKVPDLLDRIQYNAVLEPHTMALSRIYITVFFSAIVYNFTVKKPNIAKFIVYIIVTGIISYFSWDYFEYHTKYFPSFYTRKNVHKLRKKLGIKSEYKEPFYHGKFPDHSKMQAFDSIMSLKIQGNV